MTELRKRVLTSLIAILAVTLWLFAAKLFQQDWSVGVLLAFVTLICGVEYLNLFEKADVRLERYSFLAFSVLLTLSYVLFDGRYASFIFWLAVTVPVLIYLPQQRPAHKMFAAVFGIIYAPYLLHFFYLIYKPTESGIIYAMLLLVMVWSYDIGAFVIGSLWGRHKLAPVLSPQKSWEGVLGGFFFTFIAANLSPLWLPLGRLDPSVGLSTWLAFLPHIVALSLAVSAATQLGDLFWSKLKRMANVKDTGGILPGHGGLLDRIDGLLFALPVFYFYFHYVLKFV